MTNLDLEKLAAAMDRSPAFKSLIEDNATPAGLRLLAKYPADQQRRTRWMHRLAVLFAVLLALFVIVSFAALGWGFHFACPAC